MQVVQTICDPCYAENIEVLSEHTRTVRLDKKVVKIDVCEDHSKAIDESLAFVFKLGRRPEPADNVVDDDGVFQCSVASCQRSFKTQGGLRRHVTRVHT